MSVLKAGKISHQSISKLTGINRTTVYSIARKLQGMGLVTEDLGAKINYLVPEKPEAIEHIFRKEAQELSEKQKAAHELVEELATYTLGQSYSVPKIRFVEEQDLTNFLYKRYGDWAENGRKYDNTWWGFEDDSFTEKYKTWIDWSWEYEPGGIKVKFFTNTAAVEEEMSQKYPDRSIKALPPGEEFDSSLWIMGDYIIMARTRERPHYLVEIYDSVLARNQRQLFKSLWDATK